MQLKRNDVLLGVGSAKNSESGHISAGELCKLINRYQHPRHGDPLEFSVNRLDNTCGYCENPSTRIVASFAKLNRTTRK